MWVRSQDRKALVDIKEIKQMLDCSVEDNFNEEVYHQLIEKIESLQKDRSFSRVRLFYQFIERIEKGRLMCPACTSNSCEDNVRCDKCKYYREIAFEMSSK